MPTRRELLTNRELYGYHVYFTEPLDLRPHSPNDAHTGFALLFGQFVRPREQGDAMKKIVIALVATAAIGTTTLAASSTADARYGYGGWGRAGWGYGGRGYGGWGYGYGGWGLGGFATGVAVGGALVACANLLIPHSSHIRSPLLRPSLRA